MAAYKPPRLTRRVTLQTATVPPGDEYGAVQLDWTTATSVKLWADVEELGGREFVAAQQGQALATHRVTIRYRAGLSTRLNRILWDGRTLNIDSAPNPDGRKRYLALHCIESFEQTQARGF